jgi:hypothetical protein
VAACWTLSRMPGGDELKLEKAVIEIRGLPPAERVEHFEHRGKRARIQAEKSCGSLRLASMRLADRWDSSATATYDNSKVSCETPKAGAVTSTENRRKTAATSPVVVTLSVA